MGVKNRNKEKVGIPECANPKLYNGLRLGKI